MIHADALPLPTGLHAKRYSVAVVCFMPDFGHLQPLLKIADVLATAGVSVRCYVAGECARLMSRIDLPFVQLEDAAVMQRTRRMERVFSGSLFANAVCLRAYHLNVFPQVARSVLNGTEMLKAELEVQCPDVILCDGLWFLHLYARMADALGVPLVVNSLDGSLAYCQRSHVQIFGLSDASLKRQKLVESLVAVSRQLCGIANRLRHISRWLRAKRLSRQATRAFEAAFPVPPGEARPAEWIVVGMAAIERSALAARLRLEKASRREFAPLRFRSRVLMPADLLAWIGAEPERPVVYVSFGSAVALDRRLAAALYEGFRRVPARILWSLPVSQHALLGGLPRTRDIRIEPFVPQAEILDCPVVRCFVTQGGPHSVQEALFGATPILCIPFFADQAYNSSVVELLGVGRRLWRSEVTPEAVSAGVNRLLNDPAYALRARILRNELEQKEGGRAIVRFFAELIDGSSASRATKLES